MYSTISMIAAHGRGPTGGHQVQTTLANSFALVEQQGLEPRLGLLHAFRQFGSLHLTWQICLQNVRPAGSSHGTSKGHARFAELPNFFGNRIGAIFNSETVRQFESGGYSF